MSIRSVVLIFNIGLLEQQLSIIFALLKLMKINAMIYASGGKKDCSTNLSDITVKQNKI
jgi:hypothetical protein